MDKIGMFHVFSKFEIPAYPQAGEYLNPYS
jgi:hypothetical protein